MAGGVEGYGGTGTTRISTDSAGNQATGGNSFVYAISADGRYVAFSSTASNLVAGDSNGLTDSFIKDTVTGITTRITVSSSGEQGNFEDGVEAQVSAIRLMVDSLYLALRQQI